MNSRGIRPYFFSGSLLSDPWLFFQKASGDLRRTVLGGRIAEADLVRRLPKFSEPCPSFNWLILTLRLKKCDR